MNIFVDYSMVDYCLIVVLLYFEIPAYSFSYEKAKANCCFSLLATSVFLGELIVHKENSEPSSGEVVVIGWSIRRCVIGKRTLSE